MPPDLERLRIQRTGEDQPRPASSRARILILALAAILLGLAGLYLWGPLQPAREVSVTVVSRLYPAQAYTVLNASGYVVAQRKAAVSSKSTGRLVFLGVEEGSRVKRGQVIASLENEDLAAARNQAVSQVKQAEADLGTAQAELVDAELQHGRYQTLVAQDLIPKQDFDSATARFKKAQAGVAAAQARIKVAQAGVANAQAALDYTYIRSPFDGVVTTKYADVGEVVAPFGAAANARAAVVTMADLTSLMVEVDVAESNLDKVHLAQPCEISLDAIPNRRFAGQVHMIVPTADRTKATVLTKVKFLETDERILPEMSAKVAFLSQALDPAQRQPRLIIPKGAVVTRDGRAFSFVMTDNRAKLVPLTLGPAMNDLVEIDKGLKEGDRVILNPPAGLQDGARVKVKES
ncbi:MAG: efflux RND transporter periplasmic adaptor subunit [Syntrophobacterales bacterium]|nr:efflux RND transporter periplasmic adaptor subunit [Syntrophobacterales bacterium]